jgi:hypothetical protein
MKVHEERMEAKMEACLEVMEAKVEVYPEKTEATEEHYQWVPSVKSMHLLTTLRGWASNVLHGIPKEAIYCMRRLLGQLKTDLGAMTWPQGTAIN